MVGKASPDELRAVIFERLGADDDAVQWGPAYGEDAAALEVGGETLVVSTDPISLAAERVGTLGVPVACNDVAASGADPAWLTVTAFLPADRPAILDAVTEQLDAAAREAGVAIVGGHTEYVDALDRPTLSLTAMGTADAFVPTGGATAGDAVLLTKGAAIEATAILATDFRERAAETVPATLLTEAETYFDELSVTPDARILREYATAMHDPTEGGLIDGLLELAVASDATVAVERSAVPVREPTRALCDALNVDPLATFGSGALLATVPQAAVDGALADLDGVGVDAARIGTVREGAGVLDLDGEAIREPVRDEMYALWDE